MRPSKARSHAGLVADKVHVQHADGDPSLMEAAMVAACRAADEADLGGGKRPGKMLISPGTCLVPK